MPLEQTKEKLYKKASDIQSRIQKTDPLDPRNIASKEAMEPKKKEWSRGNEVTQKQKKLLLKILIGIGILVALLSLSYAYYLYKKSAFSSENFILTFDAPELVNAGETFSFKLLYHNNNREGLKNCQLKISHPQELQISKTDYTSQNAGKDFVDFEIPKIDPRANGALNFEGKVIEKEEKPLNLEAVLFCPRKKGGEEEIQHAQQGINVQSSKIFLQFESTRQAASGDVVEYFLKIKNNTDENLNNVEARINYPEGFTFSSSNIAAANQENSIFKFATLTPREEVEVKITGNLTGASSEKKRAVAQIGISKGDEFNPFVEEIAETEIISSPLTIQQTISNDTSNSTAGIADSGDRLIFSIEYKNTSNLPLRDAIVTTKIDGVAIDYNSVETQTGGFDLPSKTITWRPGEVEALAILEPQEEGTLSFNLRVLSHLPSDSLDQKNFTISSVAQIDSPDIPTPIGANKIISSDKQSVKINTKIIFETAGYYNDSLIPNTGPIPPRVNEETTYAIHWKITNINNDLSDVIVKTVLPNYVIWKDNTFPSRTEQLSYDERSREVIWNLTNVPALTGTQLAAKEITFQIGVIPQEHQIGKNLLLTNETILTGKDTFTGKSYQLTSPEINSELESDPSIGPKDGEVVK